MLDIIAGVFIFLCHLGLIFGMFELGYIYGVGACEDLSFENIGHKFIKEDNIVEPDTFENILNTVPNINDCMEYSKKSFKEWCKECLEKITKR